MKSKDLTTGTVWKKLVLFFLPVCAATLIQRLYNAADSVIVGKFVSTEALAAVGGSASKITGLLVGFFVSVTSGASVVIAQIFGAGKKREVGIATGNAIALFGVIGLALGVVGYCISPWMLEAMKTPADTMGESITYLRIYFAAAPFMLIYNMESNTLRAVGDSTTPFIVMLVGSVLNIVLDLWFVIAFDWGVMGVAVATVISQVVSMLLMTAKLMFTKEEYRLHLSEIVIRKTYLGSMMRIGIPAGLQSTMFNLSNLIIQSGVNTLGTVVVASWALASKADGLFWGVSNAVGTSITAFVGQNVGAGKMDRTKQCIKDGTIMAFVSTLILIAFLLLCGPFLLTLMTDDPIVMDQSYIIMLYLVPFFLIWTIVEVLTAILRGAGDAFWPVVIVGLGICLFRVIWNYSAFIIWPNVFVLCINYGISYAITAIALLVYYKKGSWRKRLRKTVDEMEA